MAMLILFIILFSPYNVWCSIPEQNYWMTSKASRDKRFSRDVTEENSSLENLSSNYEDSSGEHSSSTDSGENYHKELLDDEIPYSEHEHPKEISTHPNYTAPGDWAKPPPNKNGSLEFIPTKLYAQVRASHTIKRVPQEEVSKSAETQEDKENIPRLREVVTNSKVATVYTEEGYEDTAYDHGGHAKKANIKEGYARNLRDELDHEIPEYDDFSDDHEGDSDESTRTIELKNREGLYPSELRQESVSDENVEKMLEDMSNNTENHPRLKIKKEIDQLKSKESHGNAEVGMESEIYGTERITKLRKDYDYDKINLLKHDKGNLQLEDTIAPVYTVRPRKQPNIRRRNSQKNIEKSGRSRKQKGSMKLHLKDILNSPEEVKSYDETAYLESSSPRINPTNDYEVFTLGHTSATDTPATTSHDETIWKNFKKRQSRRATPRPTKSKVKTTIHPDMNSKGSINGHGPYLVLTEKRSISTPSTLKNIITPYLMNNSANNQTNEFGYSQWPVQNVQRSRRDENVDRVGSTYYPDIIDYTTESSTLGNIDNKSEIYSNNLIPFKNQEDSIYSSTSTNDSKPLAVDEFLSPQKTTHYDHNPFLVSYARSSKVNLPRYTVLVRSQAHNNEEEGGIYQSPNSSSWQVNFGKPSNIEQSPFIQPIAAHGKLLNPSRNQRKLQPSKNNIHAKSTQNFIFFEPTLSRRVTHSDLLPHPYVSAMTKMSKKLEESRYKHPPKSLEYPLQKNNTELRMNSYSTASKQFPASFPKTEKMGKLLQLYLHPPAPFVSSEYTEYRIRNKRSEKKLGVRTKKGMNIVEPEVELLNESPKITDGVINREIGKRFENTEKEDVDHGNEPINDEYENIEIPEFEYVDEYDENILNRSTTTEMVVDVEKYPFYTNDAFPSSLTLRYIVNPKRAPKKTLGGMEFYNSRNSSRCAEVDPALQNIVPSEEEPSVNRDLRGDSPRLQGLGEKLDCFKAKYFDYNPLDNPLFLESQVEQPTLPAELNTTNFVSKIMDSISSYVSPRFFTGPEPMRFKTQLSGHKFKSKNDQFNTMKHHNSATTPYQVKIYEDVMVTERNSGHIYDKVRHKLLPAMRVRRPWIRGAA